ncbi:MAG: hypothetical protein ACI89L_000141 [Phycisphaerales bacterium]|jgi:hypothetical protein
MLKTAVKTGYFFIGVSVFTAFWYWTTLTSPQWNRKHPLQNPFSVTTVNNGILSLADGRSLTLAGISPAGGVSQEEYDEFLQVAVLQGVKIVNEYSDGSASFVAEPKFYNWCGNSSDRWAGNYTQVPLAEFAIIAGFAMPSAQLDDFDDYKRWRLEGSTQLCIGYGFDAEKGWVLQTVNGAFRYGVVPMAFADLDAEIEFVTKTSPPSKD